jgi:fructose-bisphosphate aldolase class II
MTSPGKYTTTFETALDVGRPPNIRSLFPNSKALIVSGKYIDQAMLKKGGCMTIAANGRSYAVIRGALMAAQRANAAIIIENRPVRRRNQRLLCRKSLEYCTHHRCLDE